MNNKLLKSKKTICELTLLLNNNDIDLGAVDISDMIFAYMNNHMPTTLDMIEAESIQNFVNDICVEALTIEMVTTAFEKHFEGIEPDESFVDMAYKVVNHRPAVADPFGDSLFEVLAEIARPITEDQLLSEINKVNADYKSKLLNK